MKLADDPGLIGGVDPYAALFDGPVGYNGGRDPGGDEINGLVLFLGSEPCRIGPYCIGTVAPIDAERSRSKLRMCGLTGEVKFAPGDMIP